MYHLIQKKNENVQCDVNENVPRDYVSPNVRERVAAIEAMGLRKNS